MFSTRQNEYLHCYPQFKIVIHTFADLPTKTKEHVPRSPKSWLIECFVSFWDTAQNESGLFFPSCVYKCVKSPLKSQGQGSRE